MGQFDPNLLKQQRGTILHIPGTISYQFGKKVVMTQVPVEQILKFWTVDYKAQRNLDQVKVRELVAYISRGLEHHDMYLGPLIFSARDKAGFNHETQNLLLDTIQKLFVADGHHRLSGLSQLEKKLIKEMEVHQSYNETQIVSKLQTKLERLRQFSLAIQIYLDLDLKEEQQLFSDLNQYSTNVSKNILTLYDRRDPYNLLTQELIKKHPLFKKYGVELRLSRLSESNANLTSAAAIRLCLISLLHGTVYLAQKYHADSPLSEIDINLANQFFTSLNHIFPKDAANRKKYICGNSTLMVGLATYIHSQIFKRKRDPMEAFQSFETLKFFNWRHSNNIWLEHGFSRNRKTGLLQFLSTSTSFRIIRRVVDDFLAKKKGEDDNAYTGEA